MTAVIATGGKGRVPAEDVSDGVVRASNVSDGKVVLLKSKDPTNLTLIEVGLCVDPSECLVVSEDMKGTTGEVRSPVTDEIMEGKQLMLIGMILDFCRFPLTGPIEDWMFAVWVHLTNPSTTSKVGRIHMDICDEAGVEVGEDWGRCDGVFQCREGRGLFLVPRPRF